jgi:hypothetical protein
MTNFYTNPLNFPNLPIKNSPTAGDYILIADSAANFAPKITSLNDLEFAPLQQGVPVNNTNPLYSAGVPLNGLVSVDFDVTLATGHIYFVPLLLPYNVNAIQDIYIDPHVTAPSNNINIGLYADTSFLGYGECLPTGNPLATSGNILMNGLVSYNIDITTHTTFYWLAYTIDGGSPNFPYNNASVGVGSQLNLGLLTYPTTTGVQPYYTGYKAAFTYNATLPNISALTLSLTTQTETAASLLFACAIGML